MTPEAARKKRKDELERRRLDQARCAWDFLVHGDERGPHSENCVFGEEDACSRTYNLAPYPEAYPDPELYEGTGIGALYGMKRSENAYGQLAETAGWTLVRRREERKR